MFLEFQSAEDAEEFGEEFDPPYPAVNFTIEMFDYLAVTFFTIEYLVRFLCCPRKFKFFFGRGSCLRYVDLNTSM